MSKLTRRGARNVTATLDRIASLFQENADVLGVDSRIALDFAHRCDLLSDAVETTATINYPRTAEEEVKEEEEDHSDGDKKAGMDEEGLSVQNDGWDEDQIADKVPGPHEHEADEPYMATFNEEEFHELGERQDGGSLENGAKAASSGHGFNLFA